MKFLCLHGLGTNADILEIQTGPMREVLGGQHEFDFLDGDYETGPAEDVANASLSSEEAVGDIFRGPYYSWLQDPDLITKDDIEQAVQNLNEYIAENGPYDGALGFSQGGAMIMALLFDRQNKRPFDSPLFKVAVILNASFPRALQAMAPRGGSEGIYTAVPTAHVMGTKDYVYRESVQLMKTCNPNARVVYEHNEAHTIPRKPKTTIGISSAVLRAMEMAVLKT